MYKLTSGTTVLKLVGNEYATSIPADENNEDYKIYKAWLAAGNIPEAADVVVEPVKYVPCKDIIERLEALGKYTTVKAAMSEFQRDIFFSLREGIASNDADVIAVLTALGIDYTQVLY